MDRNTIIGIVIIFGIIILFSILNQPSKEELEVARKRQDSIIKVNEKIAQEKIQNELAAKEAARQELTADTTITDSIKLDSINKVNLQNRLGLFSQSAEGKNEFITLENNKLKVLISTLGGRVYSAELKNYKTWDSLHLILFDGDSSTFGLRFFSGTKDIHTNQLFFTPVTGENKLIAENNPIAASLHLNVAPGKYIEYKYLLEPDSYILKFNIRFKGMQDVISTSAGIDIDWQIFIPGQEKGRTFENQYTAIYYKFYGDEVENLSESASDDEENISTKLSWIAYKQQFFSSFLIANSSFNNAMLKQTDLPLSDKYLKKFSANIGIPFSETEQDSIGMRFYFGPNRYNILTDYDLDMERIIPLGWGFFLMQWINRFAVIPVFNFLEGFIENYGIIILILTILLKIVLFPIAYKSYVSTAKMRVLKPQVDEINKKIPKEKTIERQQEVMKLYKRAGVNPMGGCIPMLLQFPILIAMFRFFPASIELRQKLCLWADELSSYDSILNLPFTIPFYGNHVSLFCLLMTASTIIYTWLQQSTSAQTTQMPGMKLMMYMFPVMFLFMFNSYSSGLSYYYLLANLLTFAQMAIIKRFFIDDEAVLKKLEEAKNKPIKKSRWQERLEKFAKNRGYKLPKK